MEPETHAVVTDEVRAWIGRSTGPVPLPEEISASDLRRYVEATGDANPLWCDDELARSAGYRGRLVPPMMVIDLSWRSTQDTGGQQGRLWHAVPLPDNYTDTRNAGQDIEWLAPVYVGDRLSIEHRITDIVAKQGRAGLGVYITRQSEYRNQDGATVIRLTQTIVRLPRREGYGEGRPSPKPAAAG